MVAKIVELGGDIAPIPSSRRNRCGPPSTSLDFSFPVGVLCRLHFFKLGPHETPMCLAVRADSRPRHIENPVGEPFDDINAMPW